MASSPDGTAASRPRTPASAAHDAEIRTQFRKQAETFTDTGFAARGLEWITGLLAPGPDEHVLDVAAGAVHLGRALAPRVRAVTAVDLTPEMLRQGRRLGAEAGLRNVRLVQGDVAALPFPDGRFDLVVCRLAVHQVADPAAMLAEMVRVARPGGRIGVTDMAAVDDPRAAAEGNRLERLRDPSHHRTRTLPEIEHLVTEAGAEVTATDRRDNPLDLEDWMARARTPDADRAAIRSRFAAELDGGAPTGLRPSRGADGAVTFRHTWATVVAGVPHPAGA